MKIKEATIQDKQAIEDLMVRSMLSLGKSYYSSEQIQSICQFVCRPDQQLIADQTFYVIEDEAGNVVGCGGWSFRDVLYAGPAHACDRDKKLDPLTDPAKIRAMFVDPLQNGKGIGSIILDHCEKQAQAFGFKKGALGATLSG